MSVPTIDEDAWRTLEPGTAHPMQRLRAVRALVDAGIDAGVLMAPLVPGFSTAPAKIEAHHQGHRRSRRALRRRQRAVSRGGTRDHFMRFLDASFPALVDRYDRLYASKYAPKDYVERVQKTVGMLKARYGLSEQAAARRRTTRHAKTRRRDRQPSTDASEPPAVVPEASCARGLADRGCLFGGDAVDLDRQRRRRRRRRGTRSALHQIWLSGILMRSSITRFRNRAP